MPKYSRVHVDRLARIREDVDAELAKLEKESDAIKALSVELRAAVKAVKDDDVRNELIRILRRLYGVMMMSAASARGPRQWQ